MCEKKQCLSVIRLKNMEDKIKKLTEDMKLLTEEYDLLNRKVYGEDKDTIEYR